MENPNDFSLTALARFAARVPAGFVLIETRLGLSVCFDGGSRNGRQLYRREFS